MKGIFKKKSLGTKKNGMLLGAAKGVGAAYARDYAKQCRTISFIDIDKDAGMRLKADLEREYRVHVFFFHGNIYDEADMDIFCKAVKEQFGLVDLLFCGFRNCPYLFMTDEMLALGAVSECVGA
ncbi:MAG: SDR family NAD(P)-dependent oxidoreductase [Clostridium sp.]|nr:SDR family NAD(P)-dependent oxidoreductase [Clostridium sp.]